VTDEYGTICYEVTPDRVATINSLGMAEAVGRERPRREPRLR
jgi:hypothetical protein